ncbi:MAG: FGGY family carbohydrate kinase [Anaerolineaceae bacterium]|nr:FGGY family carbohydrate kinase [Anaerolineaceae bacterium]
MDLLIGLDIGTSCIKAGLFDSSGHVLASASSSLQTYSPEPGWAEQDPGAWWLAACQVLQQLAATSPGIEIAAIGLSGQCPGHVLVDKNQRSIGRAIIWRDQRAQAEAHWLNEQITPAQARKCLGTETLGDATTPLARLLWLKAHRPEDWEVAVSVLQPKDYVALQLTGQTATDRYSAYCLSNPETGVYDPELFARLGIDLEKLPKTLMPTEIVGEITRAAAQETGLAPKTKVVTGTIDAYCDTLAGGVACRGRAVDVAGTSEIVSLQIGNFENVEGIFSGRIGDGVTFLCGPTQAGGETLHWLAQVLTPEVRGEIDYSLLEGVAGSAPAGSDGVIFLPYLDGERTPVWDANARGCFYGLAFRHQRQHFARAVYEGVGYAIRHILELSEAGCGTQAEKIVVCGGGSRSNFWNQVKADILQRPVYPSAISETGCLGAAILASVGVSLYPDLAAASSAMVRLKDGVKPNSSHHRVYDEGYHIYRELYPALKPLSIHSAYHYS